MGLQLRLVLLIYAAVHILLSVAVVENRAPTRRPKRIRVDPVENAPDPNSYAYMRAAAARREKGQDEDDLALFADRPAPVPLAITDASVVEQAEWALRKLQNMSDSGIFRTLRLERIVNASFQPGVFHNNTILNVELLSPALLDADPSSPHTVVVMTDLEDGVRSLAIDEFPIMEPDAVEEAWRQKVMLSREARALELRKLDWEAARWQAKTGGQQECIDLCDERQQAINDFNFPPDAELEAIEAEQALLDRRMTAPPDLTRFLARQARRRQLGLDQLEDEDGWMSVGVAADGAQTP